MLSLDAPRGLKIFLLSVLLFFIMGSHSFGEDPGPKKEIGFDEKIGESIPLDLRFLDEHGQTVSLKQLFDKPVLFCLVYYRCPGLCSPLLRGVADVIDKMDLEPDKDFRVVTISFDPNETYITASDKKNNYLASMKKQIPDDSWRFLVGDSASIAQITDAVGFRYLPQGNDFMHGAAIMAVSPGGKIARYLYGTEFQPLDVKLALIEASEGRTGPTISKLMKLCYSYDPDAKQYVLSITRIAGGGILFFMAIFVTVFVIKKKKNNPSDAQKEEGGKE
jgi:protein SCO1/2